jgi:hypothetical protein
MILVRNNITDLVAGHLAIDAFIFTLEDSWMPGFSRSYERRQKAYLKAVQRHEERNAVLRMLFKKPKAPRRPPPGYSKQVAARLRQDWLDSLQPKSVTTDGSEPQADAAGINSFLNDLSAGVDDRYFALANLQAAAHLSADLLVVGPSGIWLFLLPDDGQDHPPHTYHARWLRTAEAIAASLQKTPQRDIPAPNSLLPLNGGVILTSKPQQPQTEIEPEFSSVRFGSQSDSLRWLEAAPPNENIQQLQTFHILDSLLSQHQKLGNTEPDSAVTSAEKLMKREKDELLRLAATL